MKKLAFCLLTGLFSFQSFSQSVLMFVSHDQTYYSEYIVMKEALETAGYTVDVRSSSSMDFSIYMTPYDDITNVANSLSGSSYSQFQTQFSELFGGVWDEASHDAIPSLASVDGSILEVQNMNDYVGLIVVGGTGSLDYRVDGSYSSQTNSAGTVSAADIQAAAEKLNELALDGIKQGKVLMAQCHGASIPAFWRIPNTSGSGEEALGFSFLKGGVSSGFPESETGPTLTSLDITYVPNNRVTITNPHSSLDDNNTGIGKIITTKDWYPQTVAHAARTFLNIVKTYPKTYSRTSEVNVLVLHGGAVDESNMPSSCSGGNKSNDVPCNNGTSDANLPADYTHMMELLAGPQSSDDFNINGSELDLSGSLPFDIDVESEMVAEFENYDVVIFFKHWTTHMTDELQDALVTYADNGGGVMGLHHGLYNDVTSGQNKDILANQLFGAHSTQSGWSATLTNYDVYSTNHGHFISSYLVDYDPAQTDPSAWSTNALPSSASSPYSNLPAFEIYDELYNNMAFTGTIDLGREINEITPLFSNDRSTNSITHTTAFTREVDIDENGETGRVVYFEIGERKENINSSSRFGQIVRNAVVWSANKENSMIVWDGSEWSNGSGPSGGGDDVIIDGDYSMGTDGYFDSRDLTISSGATMTIDGESALVLQRNLVNDGSLVVESGSSLLTYDANTITGNDIEIRRNTSYSDGRYSFVGTPVEQDAGIVGSDLGSNVYKYNEAVAFGSDGINRWENASSDELIQGRGYTQANQQEIIFVGFPNTGTITYSGTYTEDIDDANEGWNLVSNPYAAAINVSDFLAANANTSGSVYIWDDNGSNTQRGSNADYIVANGTMATNTTPAGGQTRYNNHLGSSQGFFVKLNGAANTDIVFDENMRVNNSNSDDSFFRKTELSIARINLTNSDGLFKQTVIGFVEDGLENELNRKYDAQAFNATSDNGLFTMKVGRSLSLNGMSQDWKIIQLQTNTKEAGIYQISVDLEGYDQSLYLKDNMTGDMINLRNESYSFSAQAGIDIDRFVLKSSPNDVLGLEEEKILVYAHNSILYIHQEVEVEREYQLFNMKGRKLMKIDSNGDKKVNLQSFQTGVYLVFDGHKTHKIILD